MLQRQVCARAGPSAPLTRCRAVCIKVRSSLPGASVCETGVPRRDALLLSAAAALTSWLVVAQPAAAVCADLDTAEAGDACRQAELRRDAGAEADMMREYKSLSSKERKVAPTGTVSQLGDAYSVETRALADKISSYMTMDVYDRARQPLIKSLKVDGSAWVSKYARGGSARKQSARSMYVAVDAVQGFIASNGLAPLPANKVSVVASTMDEALAFLADGR